MWTLTNAQRNLLHGIEADRRANKFFSLFCETLEQALEYVLTDDDIRRRLAALDLSLGDVVPNNESVALVLALSWYESAARALDVNAGRLEAPCFDGFGLPVFVQASEIFSFAYVYGYDQEQLRRIFRAVLETDKKGAVLPYELVHVLGALDKLRSDKRHKGLSRIRLAPQPKSLLCEFYAREVARAKAGSIIYSLFIHDEGHYHVERMRRIASVRVEELDGGIAHQIDMLASFSVRMEAGVDARREALRQFTACLDTQKLTYQRIVYPTSLTA